MQKNVELNLLVKGFNSKSGSTFSQFSQSRLTSPAHVIHYFQHQLQTT